MSANAIANRYDTMCYNRCGRSGLLLPALSLGLWHNFGEREAHENARAMARAAFDLGITHFDIANNYGPPPGAAESTFGRILKTDLAGRRDELVISTKAGWPMWDGPYGDFGSRKYLVASLDASLMRLGLDYVDIYYHHRPDPNTPMEETMGALAHVVRQGKALYAGVSAYNPAQTAEAARLLREMGTPCLIHQQRYNIIDRRAEEGVLETCETHGLGVIAYCPLAQGLLTDRYLHGVPADSRVAKPHGFLKRETLTAERLACIERLNAIARDRGQTLAQMALAWVLRQPVVASALIGASRPEQIRENVKVLEAPAFSSETLDAIAAAVVPLATPR